MNKKNKIQLVYQGEVENYTIEDELLDDEVKEIMADNEVVYAEVNGEVIKG